ncbi:MAG: NAD(P)/FAD-dependent oxidoreductase [Gammaproteobacteria bacterium]
MESVYEAIIIGGGPAGASTAILLAQAGWSVALVEKQRFPRRKVCGECIAAPNLPLLDALGVGAAFADLAGPELRRIGVFAGGRILSAELPRFGDGRYPWGRALGREYLDDLLLQRAAEAGACVWQPWGAREIGWDCGSYHCRVQSLGSGVHRALVAPVLVAADGSWEPCLWARSRVPRRPGDLFAFKANFLDCDLDPGLLPVLAFPGGYGGMVVADHGRVTMACCIRRDALQRCRDRHPRAKAGECIQEYLQESCLGVRRALSGAKREGVWLSAGPVRPGIRATWGKDGVYMAGNAAGEAHPIIGEGISMAIQAASLLSEQLVSHRAGLLSGRAIVGAGQEYAFRWRNSFAARIRASALLANLAMRPGAAAPLLPLLQRWPTVLTRTARMSGKVRPLVTQATRARTLEYTHTEGLR